MLADGLPPLHALIRPLSRNAKHLLSCSSASRWKRKAAGIECDERELEPLPLAPEDVVARNLHVVEANDAVLDCLEAHEAQSMRNLDPGHACVDYERRDLLDVLAVLHLLGRARHHHEQLGARSICAPQLLAVDDEMLTILRRRRSGLHVRGIGACIDLSKREGRDRPLCETREEAALLLFSAKELERLWNADGLACG